MEFRRGTLLTVVFTVSSFQSDASPLIVFVQLSDQINQFRHSNCFYQACLAAVSFIMSAKRRKSATW